MAICLKSMAHGPFLDAATATGLAVAIAEAEAEAVAVQAHLGYKITGNKIRPKVKTIRSKWYKTDKVLEGRPPAPVNRPSDHRPKIALFQSVRPSVRPRKVAKTVLPPSKLSKATKLWMQWTKWLSERLYVKTTKTMFMCVYRR